MASPCALLTQLCKAHIKKSNLDLPFDFNEPFLDKNNLLKKLKIYAYNILLTHSKNTENDDLDTYSAIAIKVFNLRSQRQFDKADRLEDLNHALQNSASSATGLQSILKLLVLLAEETKPYAAVIGHEPIKYPILVCQQDAVRFRPPGPEIYGESRFRNVDNSMYMEYESDLFQRPSNFSIRLPDATYSSDIFELTPGMGLKEGRFFSSTIKKTKSSELEKNNPFFGAFLQNCNLDLNIKLEIPDLPEDQINRHLDMQLIFKSQISEDEGFIEKDVPAITPNSTDEQDDIDLWELAQKCPPITYYNWETIGCMVKPSEKPFLTEAGPQVINEIIKMKLYEALLLDSSIKLPVRYIIDRKFLVKHIINLLIGVPSEIFRFSEVQQAFYLQDGVCMSGITCESLTNLLSDFTESGTYYYRLNIFSLRPVLNSRYSSGLVFQAFVGGVRRYLQYYRACILSLDQNKSLLRIKISIWEVLSQLKFLSKLCLCSQETWQNEDGKQESFPTGVKLLSYLYQEALDACHASHYPLMLSLLHTSCGPYILFIRNWILHGICHDIYEEFMISVNEDYLAKQDKYYWTDAFVMMSSNIIECVPLFLAELAKDIYICGKSINLLKRCCPEHHMCKVDSKAFPFALTFSESELIRISRQTKMYVSRLQQIARQRMLTREQMVQKQERDKQILMTQAKETAIRELQRLQDNLLEKKKAEDAKKRHYFQELKEQMQQNLERRLMEKQKEAERNAEYISEMDKIEVAQTVIDQEIKRDAKEEILSYYARLNEEAVNREQLAAWKIKRHKNDCARKEFLNTEEEHLKDALMTVSPGHFEFSEAEKALESKKFNDDVEKLSVEMQTISDVNASIEEKVQKPNSILFESELTEDAKSVIDFLTDTSKLPNWAQKTLISSATVTIEEVPSELLEKFKAAQEEHEGFEEMPKWAQIRLITSNDNLKDINHSVENSKTKTVNITEKSKIYDLKLDSCEIAEKPLEENIATDPVKEYLVNVFLPPEKTDNELKQLDEMNSVKINDEISCKLGESISPCKKDIALECSSSASKSDLQETIGESDEFSDDQTRIKIEESQLIVHQFEEQSLDKNVEHQEKKLESETSRTLNILETTYFIEDKLESGILTCDAILAHASQETEECAYKSHVKMNPKQHASLESNEEEFYTPLTKIILEKHPSVESEEVPRKSCIRMITEHHPSVETSQNSLANVSQAFETFAYKKSIRFVDNQHSSKQSDDHVLRSSIKLFSKHHSSKQSDHGLISGGDRQDKGAMLLSETFTMQTEITLESNPALDVMESCNINDISLTLAEVPSETIEPVADNITITELIDNDVWSENCVQSYQINFDIFDQPPSADMMCGLPEVLSKELEATDVCSDFQNIDAFGSYSLPILIERSIITPLLAQSYLVNQSIVNYFMVELEICHHFEALRRFLFLEDGEFGQALSNQLFEKLANCVIPVELLNPVVLNAILVKALKSSLYGESKEADNLAFVVRYLPHIFQKKSVTTLNCLELSYKVYWPNNIVITENSLSKYNMVFTFMLQVRQAMWALNNVWHNLKRTAVNFNSVNSPQLRQLQLYRHEMQHFVKIMQGYIANQIIQVSWEEFQQELNTNICNLDDLHDRHGDYLNKAIFRCLLSKKAKPVMKIIQDILSLILKFRLQMISASWNVQPPTHYVVHPNFHHMANTFAAFKEYASFLYKVVNKLVVRGYQPHLQDFLLRLNFNSYYTT